MELTESIESLNHQLIDLFGIDTVSGNPIWRIVFSEDQFENRLGTYSDYTESGIYLRTVTEVRYVPKYRQWIQERFVLERLTIIPEINSDELPSTRLSYEPIYVFENGKGDYLPPKIEVARIVIDSVYAAQGKSSMAKYLDDEDVEKRIDSLQEYLFADETDISDHLSRQTGIIVPSNYKKES